ncbi:MAG: HK97 family phage prohead protease [Bacillota bacterium]
MKYKSFPTEFKVDTEENTFEGYAAVFGNKDSYGDIIEKGAFAKTLKEHGQRVKVLWQHDPWTPIGKPIEMKEDDRGLRVKGRVSDTDKGREALRLMRDDVVNELSIGYDPIKKEPDQERDANILKEVRLWEFSPVTFAANELDVITGVKNTDEIKPFLKQVNELKRLTKEGRVLSESNYNKLREAKEAIEAVINSAEPEDKSTQHKDEPGDHSSEVTVKLLSDIKNKRKEMQAEKLVEDLKDFGKKLRGVN